MRINRRNVESELERWPKRMASSSFEQSSDYVFDNTAAITRLTETGLSQADIDAVETGKDVQPDNRSESLYGIVIRMIMLGLNNETIITHLTNKDNYLGRVALSRRNNNISSARQWLWSQVVSKAQQVAAKQTRDIHDSFDYIDESAEEKTSKPNQYVLTNAVIQKLGEDNLVFANGSFWRWDAEYGVWASVSDQSVKQIIQTVIPKLQITKSIVDNVLSVTKTMVHKEKHRFNQLNDGINTLNGTIRFIDNRWILTPHEKTEYRTSVIPVEYDPTAEAPRCMQFEREVFRDDPDIDDKIFLLRQAMGYTLLSSTPYPSFFIFEGSGANGKSVCLDLIRALCGTENVSAVQMNQMANRFQRAQMNGKLANLVSELPEGGRLPDAEIKSDSSGELTTVENKGRDPFEIIPFYTMFFATNHLPHTRDLSPALQRRARIIRFNRTFSSGEQDPHLIEKLKGELPGILNQALEALKHLFTDGAFVEPQSSKDAKKDWLLQSDQVTQFVNESCVLNVDGRVSVDTLYRTYRMWATDSGFKSLVTKKTFTQRLVISGVGSTKSGSVRYYSGVQIDPGDLLDDDDDDDFIDDESFT